MTEVSFVPKLSIAASTSGFQRHDWITSSHRDPGLLWLDKNENTDPILQAVVFRVLAEMDPLTVATYPDATPFYYKLAEYLGVSPRSLVLGQGSDGVIGSVFRAFINPGDIVLLTQPTYAMYQVYADISGAETVTLEYMAGENGPLLKPETVIKKIRKWRPKLICLPNPDSPTGTVIEPDVLQDIIRSALEVGSLILVDEAYYPFYANTVVPWIAEFPNLIVVRTFSKAWGLTGVRLGYGIASPDVIAMLQRFRANYEANTVALAMALRMISDFDHEMRASVKRLNKGRDEFLSTMKELGLRTLESQGSFCHVAFGSSAERVHASLGDIVLYRQDFSAPCLKGFSRFSSTTSELFAPVINRIRDVALQGGG
jgi:histidinol-phosphate aminotransferase